MNKELLFSVTKKDFDITWFSGKGAGGQHRNKHQNCCRIIHRESGAMGVGQNERTRPANQKSALSSLVYSRAFQSWLKLETSKRLLDNSEIEKKVEKEMSNIKIEQFENGKWEEVNLS